MDPSFLATQLVRTPEYRRLFLRTQAFADATGTVSNVGQHSHEAAEWIDWSAGRLGMPRAYCRLITLAHDFGKAPYGHPAEEVLHAWGNSGYTHPDHGVVRLERLESRYGWDFGTDVKLAMRRHRTSLSSEAFRALPLPEQLLGFADKGSHVTTDTTDALAAGLISVSEFPEQTLRVLGPDPADWPIFLSDDLVANSDPENGILRLSDSMLGALIGHKAWLVEAVYEPHGRGYLEKEDFKSVLDYLSHRDGRSGTADDKLRAVDEFADLTDADIFGIAEMLSPEYVDLTDGKSSVHIGGSVV